MASGRGNRPRSRRRPPCRATSPGRVSRLVTTTAQDDVPGSSGRICSTEAALSNTTSIRRPIPERDQQAADAGGVDLAPVSGGAVVDVERDIPPGVDDRAARYRSE